MPRFKIDSIKDKPLYKFPYTDRIEGKSVRGYTTKYEDHMKETFTSLDGKIVVHFQLTFKTSFKAKSNKLSKSI